MPDLEILLAFLLATAVFAYMPGPSTASLPLWGQLLVLGTVVNLMFSSADLLCVLLADRVTTALRRSPRASRWAKRCGGGVLIALGVNLTASDYQAHFQEGGALRL